MPPRLFLLRHGETEWSRTGRHTGRTDLPLEPAGRQMAERAGRLLGKRPFAAVWVSPLLRAKETCWLAGYGDVAVENVDLVEWDYGEYEGRTTEDIRRERPGWVLWDDGVPGGESLAEVSQRADRVIESLPDDGDVLCVAHGHILRVLGARWVGLPPDGARLLALDAGSVSLLGWEREQPVVVRWNELG